MIPVKKYLKSSAGKDSPHVKFSAKILRSSSTNVIRNRRKNRKCKKRPKKFIKSQNKKYFESFRIHKNKGRKYNKNIKKDFSLEEYYKKLKFIKLKDYYNEA